MLRSPSLKCTDGNVLMGSTDRWEHELASPGTGKARARLPGGGAVALRVPLGEQGHRQDSVGFHGDTPGGVQAPGREKDPGKSRIFFFFFCEVNKLVTILSQNCGETDFFCPS